MWFTRARDRPPKLWAYVSGVGEVEVILGQQTPRLAQSLIVTGRSPEWIDALDQYGLRMTIRTADIAGLVVD